MAQPWTKERTARVSRLIRSMYAVVKELEEEFVTEDRKFTLDGHLVGSIGEVVAAYAFGLTLYPSSKNTHDGETEDGRKVQIKLTGGSGESGYQVNPNTSSSCNFETISFPLSTMGLVRPYGGNAVVTPKSEGNAALR